MADLTTALLHLARMESGMETERESCSIASLVRESVEKHHNLTSDNSVTVDFHLLGDPPLQADKILASVVVDNLMANAIQHSEAGQVSIHLDPAKLVIRDSGKGIAETELDQIFQRHFRGSGSRGAGIGLSLVKRICDLYGWKILIDSKPDRGTKVTLAFDHTT